MKFGKFFYPMLLKERVKPFDSEKYLYELKFDGLRATIHVSKKEFIIFSRNGKNITNQYPELKNLQKGIKEKRIFDGEIVLIEKGYPSFEKLSKRISMKNQNRINNESKNNPVCFIAFDCLYKNKDLTKWPLIKRKEILGEIKDNDFFVKTKYFLKEGKKLYKNIKRKNLEGIVAKKITSIYVPNTRSEEWIKIKNNKTETFIVGGYKEEEKKSSFILYLGEEKKNHLYFVGKINVGKKRKIYSKIKACKKNNKNPFIDLEEKNIIYLNEKITCKIKYENKTKNNRLRHAIFVK